jgi:hypothetical protein
MPAKKQDWQVVNDPSEIPEFKNEDEEHEFWSTHSFGEGMFDGAVSEFEDILPPVRPRTRPVAVRFDDDMLRRLKAVAARKHKGYQTLLKEFVTERLYEEEKREGIIGGPAMPTTTNRRVR